MTLRPHDLLVLLALVARPRAGFEAFADLAEQTGVSTGEVHKSLRRSEGAGLYRPASREPVRHALHEFLVHGVRYAFPAVRGPLARGTPTGVAAPPLADVFGGGALPPDLTPVWPDVEGERRGYAVEPLYRTVPDAARRDPALYRLLALTDALREGRARERAAARDAFADLLRT